MTPNTQETLLQHPAQFTSRKEQVPGDAFSTWIDHYLDQAVLGVRSEAVVQKITLHLRKFLTFFLEQYGHERLSTCVKRDLKAWQRALKKNELAPATINNYLASLSGFMTWICAHAPTLFPVGSPTRGVGELPLPALEPRSLLDAQVRSLKSFCDRLHRFQERRGRRWKGKGGVNASARPLWDRALVFLMLSTGLRREEVTQLDWAQFEPQAPDELKNVRKARLSGIKGKGGTERTVILPRDARLALADYLETERSRDVTDASTALFLSVASQSARRSDGRLSPRAINMILEQIGRWHDSEMTQEERKISPLQPHDLRHTFAFRLARTTRADAYELERRLGHRSQRYIQRYTNPPESVAAQYIEEF